MEPKELQRFGADELVGRVRQWREELFRSRFKGQTSEARDTSVYKKLRKDIARALTVLNQKLASGDVPSSAKKPATQVLASVTTTSKNAPTRKSGTSAVTSPGTHNDKRVAKAKTTKKKKAE